MDNIVVSSALFLSITRFLSSIKSSSPYHVRRFLTILDNVVRVLSTKSWSAWIVRALNL